MHSKQVIRSIFVIVILLITTQCVSDKNKASQIVDPSSRAETPIAALSSTEEPSNSEPRSTPSAEAEPIVPGEVVHIRLVVENHEETTYQQLIKAFERENPDIQVEVITPRSILDGGNLSNMPPEEIRLRLAMAADVLTVNTSGHAIREGLRLDLTSLIAADKGFDPDDFYPGLLEEYQWDGKTWAVPITSEFSLLVYNRDAFDEGGVDYPAEDWGWEDMLGAALALTVRENGEVVQWGFADRGLGVNFFPNLTGSFLAINTVAPEPRFNDPTLVAEMQWYTDLFTLHQVAPYPSGSLESLDNFNVFLSKFSELVRTNRVAMRIGSSFFLSESSDPSGADLGIVPLPGCSPAFTGTVSISPGTQNPEAAWRLVTFLSQQFVVASGDFARMPARRSVAEAGGFYNEVNSELANALLYATDHACPKYRAHELLGAYEAFSAFQSALEDILAGDQSVPEALSAAQVEAETAVNAVVEAQANATPIPAFTVRSATDTAAADQPNIAIAFNILGGADDSAAVRQVVAQFTAVHPDIAVEVTAVQSSSLASNAAQSACFQSTAGFAPNELATVLSLDPLLDADSELTAVDFYPSTLQAFTANGQLMALPGQMDVTLIAYNKDVFDAAGIPYPQSGWTTADFLTTAQALTQGEGENQQFGYLPGAFESTDLLDWLERLGANLLDESASPPTLALDDPSVVAALEWYAGLTTNNNIRPAFEGGIATLSNSGERRDLIENGRSAMWLDSSFSQGGRALDLENVGYVSLPVGGNGRSSLPVQSITGYFISAKADGEQRQACWEWISYLTTQPNVNVGLPARVETAVSSEYTQLVGDEKAAVQLQAVTASESMALSTHLEQEQPWLLFPFRTQNGNLSAQLMTRIISDQIPVTQALAEAHVQFDVYRACVVDSGETAVSGIQLSCWRQTIARQN